jgi:hypothetical protein
MNTESNTKQQVHKTHLDERCRSQTKQRGRGAGRRGRVGIKKPTQKNPKKNHLKKPTKSGFFRFFLNFKFFMKITKTFLFQTDFYEQISNKLSFIFLKIVRYSLNWEYFRKK